MKKTVASIVIGACFFLYTNTYSEPAGCGKCGMMHDGMTAGMHGEGFGPLHDGSTEQLERLDLDQNQKAAIRDIQNKARKELIKKKPEMQIAMIELQELLGGDAVDMKTVESKLRQVESLRTALHLIMIKEQADIRSKLTPEQRKRLLAMDDDSCPKHRSGGEDCKGHGSMHR